MKFLAILRDSLRETLDVKLFYVMVGLSLLVVLLVGSISYKPVSMERRLTFQTNLINLALRAQLQSQPEMQGLDAHIDIKDFQQTGGPSEPWLADYSFVYSVSVSDDQPQGPAGVLGQKGKKGRELFKDNLKRAITAEQLGRELKGLFTEVDVKEMPPQGDEQLRYQVTTSKGTPVKSRQEWFHEPALFFGLVPVPVPLFSLGREIEFIGDDIIGSWGAAFTMLISTIMTASFLPNMLSKGTVDLLLVKPIHRVTLFLYKFLGGLLFMFLNTVIIMVGIWVGMGLQSGVWVRAFLLCIFVFTFQFAIFYAVSALAAVLTRSAIVAILAAMMTWAALVVLGWTHWVFIEKGRADKPASTREHWAYIGYDLVHTALPRYKDLDWLTSKIIQEELLKPVAYPAPDPANRAEVEAYERRQKVTDEVYERQLKKIDKDYGAFHWASSLTVSGLFIALVLGLACWRFATRDY
jgi:ABC-type transport system involved in multi-copper enzyme maturation permease subunit